MILVVGLGNSGKKYEKTRHNIGFRVIDQLQSLNLKKVILTKPQTFMNLSGRAVKSLIKKYKIPIPNLWVIHDDIDLPLGKIKIVKNRGSAGHKGVESIIKELKTKNFVRFRIGICPKTGKPKNPEKFVLQKFNKEEEKIIKEVIKKTAEAIEFSLKEGLEKAQSTYNICARPST
jgi:PTH1 family peptidyl-tRNA hydrolase